MMPPNQKPNHNPNQKQTENYIPMANSEHPHQPLKSIEVNFDEIRPVTSDDIEIPAKVLNEVEVHPIGISPETMDEELEALMAEIKELAFLPFVTGEETEELPGMEEKEEAEAAESLENIEGYSLSDFEVSFIEKNTDSRKREEVDFNLEEEPIADVKNLQVEDVISWLMADNELREIECNYQTVPYPADAEIARSLIPEPVYYDELEAYMMGLLDDLEELGDHREIPLLEELRAEESKSFIKDRIDTLIERFAHERDVKVTMKSVSENKAPELPVFSVFADLFKSIDTESKLILLDEVVAVGDEKEIEFLDGLLEDPDQKIRDRAQTVLKQLIAKLCHENPSATYSKAVSAIFAKQIKDDGNLCESIYNGLISEMEIIAPARETEVNATDTP
jgi:hypothetical protein